jgi:hypothetical protein
VHFDLNDKHTLIKNDLSINTLCSVLQPIILKAGSKFLQSKYYGELAVKEEFPEAIIFRPSVIYGQEDRFLR